MFGIDDALLIPMLLGMAGSVGGSMLQKKPQAPQGLVPTGTKDNPGYIGVGRTEQLNNAPPDNRMANGIGSAGSIMSLMSLIGGGGGGGGANSPIASTTPVGSDAPMVKPNAMNGITGNDPASGGMFGFNGGGGGDSFWKRYFG